MLRERGQLSSGYIFEQSASSSPMASAEDATGHSEKDLCKLSVITFTTCGRYYFIHYMKDLSGGHE